ncbi:MAG: hypothetical protein FH749_10540 [Firmicutes bacterium]|nr:hypothetical protein [Bacillota bacterium]
MSIHKKLKLNTVCLMKVSGELIKSGRQSLQPDMHVGVEKVSEEVVFIGVQFHLESRNYQLALRWLVHYDVLEPVTRDEVVAEMNSLLIPCLQQNSILVGILTEKIVGQPVVLPPVAKGTKPKPEVKH